MERSTDPTAAEPGPALQAVPTTDTSGAHLVVGHDGHPASDAALRVSVRLAALLDAHVHVVHSVTVLDCGVDPDTETFEQTRDRNLAHERELIAAALADTPVAWTYHEERGDPAGCLAHLAAQVDALFIVVGTSHRGVLRHLIDAPVSARLLRLQRFPVLVVPEPTVDGRG